MGFARRSRESRLLIQTAGRRQVSRGRSQLVLVGQDAGASHVRRGQTGVELHQAIEDGPGTFGLLQATPSASQSLSREAIAARPQLGEDIYRSVNRLPGISSPILLENDSVYQRWPSRPSVIMLP